MATHPIKRTEILLPTLHFCRKEDLLRKRAAIGLAAFVMVIPPQRKVNKQIDCFLIVFVCLNSEEKIKRERTNMQKENG